MIRFSRPNQGLTLIEMVVVVAIVTIMTAVVLANLPAFRTKIELDLIAQEVAITIRQAQAFGTSARGSTGADTKEGSHGVLFDAVTSPGSFPLLRYRRSPSPPNYPYVQSGNTTVERFNFRGGVQVHKILYEDSGGWQDQGAMNIIFQRPMSEAKFFENNSDLSGLNGLTANRAKIIIGKAPFVPENCRQIVVWQTGHIYAQRLESGETCAGD